MSDKKFNVYSYKTVDSSKPTYEHVIENSTLVITKNGITLTLNDDEIIQVVNAIGLGGDVTNNYKFGMLNNNRRFR